MTIYAIGCMHFGHENIIRKANRPFSCLEEMEQTMVDNWNKTVKDKDTVLVIGDFSWKGDRPESYEKRLRGNLVRIHGNHDPDDWGVDYHSLKYMKRKFICFHYPIEEWDGWFGGSIHLHAHTHKPKLASAPRRFNVGVDATGFRPISLDEILAHPNSDRMAGMREELES
ncbi:hypothetical protein KUV57_13250 [Epibacterium sp. DP7N7-1]|nr:hypothetical protein [Epibacterium sp. DP7N7-1]